MQERSHFFSWEPPLVAVEVVTPFRPASWFFAGVCTLWEYKEVEPLPQQSIPPTASSLKKFRGSGIGIYFNNIILRV